MLTFFIYPIFIFLFEIMFVSITNPTININKIPMFTIQGFKVSKLKASNSVSISFVAM